MLCWMEDFEPSPCSWKDICVEIKPQISCLKKNFIKQIPGILRFLPAEVMLVMIQHGAHAHLGGTDQSTQNLIHPNFIEVQALM